MIPMPTSYSSLSRFYAADDRRHPSPEVDLGLRWRGADATYRAAAPATSASRLTRTLPLPV